MSGCTKVALTLGSIIIFPTIFAIFIIYGLKYANDPANVAGYATEKWGNEMKQSIVNNITSKYQWDGIMTQIGYNTRIKPPKDARYILYNFRKQKFEKLDWGDREMKRYSANTPDEISIIIVYGIGTQIVGQIVSTGNRGNTFNSDAESDYVKIELIDVNTWKVFATHTTTPERASVKNPQRVLSNPTDKSFEFVNQLLDSLQEGD